MMEDVQGPQNTKCETIHKSQQTTFSIEKMVNE